MAYIVILKKRHNIILFYFYIQLLYFFKEISSAKRVYLLNIKQDVKSPIFLPTQETL